MLNTCSLSSLDHLLAWCRLIYQPQLQIWWTTISSAAWVSRCPIFSVRSFTLAATRCVSLARYPWQFRLFRMVSHVEPSTSKPMLSLTLPNTSILIVWLVPRPRTNSRREYQLHLLQVLLADHRHPLLADHRHLLRAEHRLPPTWPLLDPSSMTWPPPCPSSITRHHVSCRLIWATM